MSHETESSCRLDPSHDLIEVARFGDSASASIMRSHCEASEIPTALSGEAAAGWYWQAASAIGGVRLLVKREDLSRANDVLASIRALDKSNEVDYQDRSDESADEQPTIHSLQDDELRRAWRASIIGFCFFPPLLNFYSMWILLRNDFFPNVARRSRWQVRAALFANMMVVLYVVAVAKLIFLPSPYEFDELNHTNVYTVIESIEGDAPDDTPYEPDKPVWETKTRTYYILP